MRKLNTEEFIKRAKEKHGDKYNYSLVEYIGALNKVIIICPEHGEFMQTPNKHMRGNACKKCSDKKITKTNEQFICDANKVHNNKYDYSLVEYNGSHDKVKIICNNHGVFEQKPTNHLSGQDCPKCVGGVVFDSETFIKKSMEIHGDLYDYSKVKYVNAKTKVTIICKIHGEFEQTADLHVSGCGCPKCRNSKGEILVKKILGKEKFIEQYNVCKNENTNAYLRADFYLSDYNFIIEYDGEQHFKKNGLYSKNGNFEKTKERDKIKNDYCKDNKINLLRIHFKSTEEEIKNKINECIEKIKGGQYVYEFLNYP